MFQLNISHPCSLLTYNSPLPLFVNFENKTLIISCVNVSFSTQISALENFSPLGRFQKPFPDHANLLHVIHEFGQTCVIFPNLWFVKNANMKMKHIPFHFIPTSS